MPKEIEHYDIFGKLIQLGDCVVSPYYGRDLGVFTVVKMTPKMVKIKRVGSKGSGQNAYPFNTVKVNGPEVTMYLLKNSEKVKS